MLWVIKDDSYAFDGGGPDTTVVRAQAREEAVRLWLENSNEYTNLKKENGSWYSW